MPQAPSTRSAARTPAVRRLSAKALPEHNRRHNRALVLQHLFHDGAMSRADLARESGLTRVTVGELIAGLQRDGIVHELGPRQGTRPGKPATLVAIDENAFHLAAIDLSPDDSFIGVITDLRGEVVHRIEQPRSGATGEAAIEKVLILVAALLGATEPRVLGIGVGTPGIVDGEGVIREAPNLGWREVDLGARIRRAFDYPVHVANDANAAALGIRTFAAAPGGGVMVVRVEHGVGAGLVIDGALVEGEQFAAGEIGHVVVDEDGELCTCGRRGCLELQIAAPHLRKRLAAAGTGADPAAGSGDGTEARDAILTEAGRSLGIILSPVVSILNLGLIVLSGPVDLIDGPLIETARATIRARTMTAVSDGLELRSAAGDEDLVLLGAAGLVLSSELGVS